MSLTLSFDIGYASIGWCVLSAEEKLPNILGTGVVTFPTDDCLASTRRDLRRTRRHIRSTRQRIERMKCWFVHRGILTREELDRVPEKGEAPAFLLAAAALKEHRVLSAFELWTVLRWYAHNRGYDGNSLWSRDEANDDDTEKETNAKSLMAAEPVTTTMAETVCKCLGLNPADPTTRISSALPYKTLNAAYPREIVFNEVKKILYLHTNKIPGIDGETVRFIIKPAGPEALTKEESAKLATAAIKLPRRYHGGLLFGQLVPRFDNRIISRCPLTWAKTYDAVKEILPQNSAALFVENFGEWASTTKTSGTRTDEWQRLLDKRTQRITNHESPAKVDEEIARNLAEKSAKVPAKKCIEFLEYRLARILANLKANGEPIGKELRQTLLTLARQKGSLTPKDLTREIKAFYGKVPTNIDSYFKIHPDSADALVLDPVADEVRKANESRAKLSPIWKLLSEQTQAHIISTWRKAKAISLAEIIHHDGNRDALIAALQPAYAKANKSKQGKTKYADIDHYLRKTTIAPDFPSGRAPYARPVLKQVLAEVLAGSDPTKPARKTFASDGENKDHDGVLYPLNDKTSRARTLEDERPLDQLTNNHLVRHRMLILDRLVEDIAKEFVTPDRPVGQVVIEVARELKEFSGKTAKQIASELNNRLKDFKSTITYLEKNAPDMILNGSLIRKARIAMDMGWRCPFTGKDFDPYTLKDLERAHIIPYATRNTNALHALVLTWPEINSKQGKRTCKQFIIEEEANRESGKSNLNLFTLKQYEAFVEGLDTKGHLDDIRRKKARKALLLTQDMDDKDLGFTDGQLTQTSHLAKLAMRGLTKRFPGAAIDPIPGTVTAEIRKAWDLTGTLSLVCPEVLDANEKVRPKDEIRSLTHMHHALDAATIALAAHYFPLRKHGEDQKGKIWKALLKRNRSPEEQEILRKTGLFQTYQKTRRDALGQVIDTRTELKLTDLPKSLKQALRLSLAQARVMQHLPADRSGAKAELTTWGIVSTVGEGEDARITLRQNSTTIEEGRRKYLPKTREERAGKLLGPNPKDGSGKLAGIKGAMIIGENYGLALDPCPTVIPFHDVTARLAELRKQNGDKPARVLRNGMLIHLEKSPALSRQDYSGVWRIASIKNNKGKFLIDMIRPAYITPQNGVEWSGMNKTLGPLLACGLTILPRDYSARPS